MHKICWNTKKCTLVFMAVILLQRAHRNISAGFVFLFSSLRKWPRDCPKHFGDNYTIKWKNIFFMTSIGPCIVIFFYSKTNQMHQYIKFILFLEWHSTCFGRSFRPSSAVEDCTYNNSKQTAVSVWHMSFALCTVQSWTPDDGRKDRPKYVECHSKNKINLIHRCIWLVLL